MAACPDDWYSAPNGPSPVPNSFSEYSIKARMANYNDTPCICGSVNGTKYCTIASSPPWQMDECVGNSCEN